MVASRPRPKVADAAIPLITVAMMGAPGVLGAQISHTLSLVLFFGGLGGLVLYLVVRWGAWLLGLARHEPRGEHSSFDNRGGVYAGGDITGAPAVYNAPVTIQHAPSPTSGPIFEETQKINAFLGGKDEWAIREVFDIPHMVSWNISVQTARIGFIQRGEFEKFFYAPPYTEGNSYIVSKQAKSTITPNSVHIDSVPEDVFAMVTSIKFQSAEAKLLGMANSGLIPVEICTRPRNLHEIIHMNCVLLIHIMNAYSHESFENFLQNNLIGSKYQNVIDMAYWGKFIQLKPPTDAIFEEIKTYWKNA